jgi:DNA-binding transcriptional MerR regulator
MSLKSDYVKKDITFNEEEQSPKAKLSNTSSPSVPQIKPKKFSGNRRFYSDKDVSTLKFVRYLLKDQRLTINGAIKVMNKNINTLDDFKSSSIKVEYFRNIIKTKSKKLLLKIKKLKN